MRMTDAERTDRLIVLAERALRKNRQRQAPMPWAEVAVSGLHNYDELQFTMKAAPSVVLRLLRRLKRLDAA